MSDAFKYHLEKHFLPLRRIRAIGNLTLRLTGIVSMPADKKNINRNWNLVVKRKLVEVAFHMHINTGRFVMVLQRKTMQHIGVSCTLPGVLKSAELTPKSDLDR